MCRNWHQNESKGEIVKAFIVLREGYNNLLTKSSIQKYMKENLAKFEIPREIRYIDDLPTTLVGKIAYKELEKWTKKEQHKAAFKIQKSLKSRPHDHLNP